MYFTFCFANKFLNTNSWASSTTVSWTWEKEDEDEVLFREKEDDHEEDEGVISDYDESEAEMTPLTRVFEFSTD